MNSERGTTGNALEDRRRASAAHVPTGYKRTEVGVIPEEWECGRLGDLCSFSNGVNADKSAYGTGVPFINVLEVITHTHLGATDIPGRVLLRKSAFEAFAVRRGDVLFNRTSETLEEVGLSAVYVEDVAVVFGGFVIRGRFIGDAMDSTYVGYGFRAPIVRAQIIAQGQGAIRANIAQANLKRVLVPIPPLAEQRAIAEALSDVDGLLGALEALIAKQRAIKQAAMQQLLTGKTRLPGFIGEWKKTTLGNLGQWRGGSTPLMSNQSYWRGGTIPWLSSSDVRQGWISGINAHITERAVAETSVPLIPPEAVIVVIRSGILRSFLPVACSSQTVAINQDLRALHPGRHHAPRFVAHALAGLERRILIDCMKAGTTVESIDSAWFRGFEISMPNLEEQNAIAAVLSDMEGEIATLENRRDKTSAIKQGMMQQLLTGRVRLEMKD